MLKRFFKCKQSDLNPYQDFFNLQFRWQNQITKYRTVLALMIYIMMVVI